MGVLRRVIFPALRILIWAVIAVALVVIAFRPGAANPEGTDRVEPWADFTTSIITPTRGDVTNVVTLSGTVVPDTSHEVKAPISGTVHRGWVRSGDDIEAGAPIITIKTLMGDGEDENLYTTTPVPANTRGMVSTSLDLGDEVTAGDVVARIFPGTFVVETEIEPLQMYQLVDAPPKATATITGGPGEFTCMTFSTKVVMGEDGARTEASCSVPKDVTVFPGLSVTLELITDSAEDVLLLPVTAVEGTIGTGKVWQQSDDGELIEVDVTLGLSDGTFVEIISGLDETDEVLEFVPSQGEPDWGFPGWGGYEEEWIEEGEFEEGEFEEGFVEEGAVEEGPVEEGTVEEDFGDEGFEGEEG